MSIPGPPSRKTLPWASRSKSNWTPAAAFSAAEPTDLSLGPTLRSNPRSVCPIMYHAHRVYRLDQEAAIDEDENAFDPDEDARDYDEVARSLSVFCVSARAYQKLSGRLKKDSVHVDGFTAPEDTEIPQLQDHARRLTEGGRVSNSRRFLNDLIQLLNSMKLWATNDGRMGLNTQEQSIDEMFLRARLAELQKVSCFRSWPRLHSLGLQFPC